MAKKLDHKFWARYFKVYDVLNLVIPYQELLDSIVNEAKINKNELVLDAGCGTGNLAIKISQKGAAVTGIDNCVEAIDRYRHKDQDADVLLHDLTKPLPFPDNSFDKVVCNNVLYTIPRHKVENVIGEIRRVLRKGGIFVAVDPVNKHAQNILREHIRKEMAILGVWGSVKRVLKYSFSVFLMSYYNSIIIKNFGEHFFSVKEKTEILENSGFKIIRIRSVYAEESALFVVEK